jgi:hypothetical protein
LSKSSIPAHVNVHVIFLHYFGVYLQFGIDIFKRPCYYHPVYETYCYIEWRFAAEEGNTMLYTHLMVEVAKAQRHDQLQEAERHRLVAAFQGPQPALARRAAVTLGHALIGIGAGLLRYGRATKPVMTRRYRASSRSVGLN